MRIFAQDQGNQGITRRRTSSTPHKESRRFISLWLIDAEIAQKGHLWMETAMKRALSRAKCSAPVIPINGRSPAGGNSCARMGPTVARRSVGVSPCWRASVPLDLALSYMGQSCVLCDFLGKKEQGVASTVNQTAIRGLGTNIIHYPSGVHSI